MATHIPLRKISRRDCQFYGVSYSKVSKKLSKSAEDKYFRLRCIAMRISLALRDAGAAPLVAHYSPPLPWGRLCGYVRKVARHATKLLNSLTSPKRPRSQASHKVKPLLEDEKNSGELSSSECSGFAEVHPWGCGCPEDNLYKL